MVENSFYLKYFIEAEKEPSPSINPVNHQGLIIGLIIGLKVSPVIDCILEN